MRLEAKIYGRVQGVGFRFTACHFAQELKLTGYVKNLPDGSVEIIAQGNRETLERFLKQLDQEFQVVKREVHFTESEEPFSNFSIVR